MRSSRAMFAACIDLVPMRQQEIHAWGPMSGNDSTTLLAI